MATEYQNWLKAYNRKNPKANDAGRKAAFQAWQKARRGRGAPAKTDKPQLPEGWGMERTPDILGSWASKPNLNIDEFESEKGLDGKYYARRRTELTGLEPYQKQSLARFDADAAARSGLMSGVETQAVNATRSIGDAGAARMADLASLVQASSQSQALGGVNTGGGATQQTSSPDQRGASQAAGAGSLLAATQVAAAAQAQAKNAPTLAAYSMSSLANRARSDDAAMKQKLLSAYRSANAESASAKDTAIARTYSDQARLLAASIQSGARITEEQLSQMGQNFRNTQNNETSLTNNTTDNQTSVANNQATANAGARATRTKATNDFVGKIVNRMDGEEGFSDDGKGGTKVTIKGGGTGWQTIVSEALARKIPLGPVLQTVASSKRGRALMGNAKFAKWIFARMKAAGIPERTAIATINNKLRVNLTPGAGVVAGPPTPRR